MRAIQGIATALAIVFVADVKQNLRVCWISAGVSSFIAGWLAGNVDEWIYIDIEDQHPDSMRFIKDCEKAIGKEIKILSSEYRNVENACRAGGFINRPKIGAYCTKYLKKRVRQKWEYEHQDFDITYIWGFDLKEKHRAERTVEEYPQFTHEFPLIEHFLSKQDCHAMIENLGIKRPVMYDMGYPNNNCVGCVKGGMGYWNKIRKDFPEVFAKRAKLERDLSSSCINGIYLDELEPDRGNMEMEIFPDCSIMCYLSSE